MMKILSLSATDRDLKSQNSKFGIILPLDLFCVSMTLALIPMTKFLLLRVSLSCINFAEVKRIFWCSRSDVGCPEV
jgi:hypothetical protein